MFTLFTMFMCLFSTLYSFENDYESDFFSELIQKNQKNHRQGLAAYLISVDVYTAITPYTKELIRSEEIIWEKNLISGEYRVQNRIIEDIENHKLCWLTYEYDEDGIFKKIIFQEGEYSKDKVNEIECYFDETIHLPEIEEDEIVDKATMRLFSIKRLLHYFEDDSPLVHASTTETAGHIIIMKYAALHELEDSLITEHPAIHIDESMHILPFPKEEEVPVNPAEPLPFEKQATSKNLYLQLLGKTAHLQEGLSYANYVKKEWDDFLHRFFGLNFLKLTGYYQYDAISGSFGSKEEVGDKVRITMINGILNIRDDLILNLRQLSLTHGGAKIHFVFRPTKGWMLDIVSCTKVKFGYVSPQAHLLAEKWKELIKEMGGTEAGGKIIHYAHSIGGSDTYAAKKLLTVQELKMIHVITLGSPTMIPNEDFASVVNYVARRDGVCMCDPINYMNGLFYPNFHPNTNIVFLGTFLGVPFIEHTLDGKSYSDILNILGEQFQKEYMQQTLAENTG